MRARGVIGVVLGGALAVVPACLGTARVPARTPLAGGGGPSAISTPTAAISAPEVAGISLRNWTAGHRPHSTPGEDCGVREALVSVDDFVRSDDTTFDRRTCFANVGCPARQPMPVAKCPTTGPTPTEMEDFLSDQARWISGAPIRLRGRLFVTDPQYRNGFSHPLAYVVGQEPHCYQHSRREVSLQLRKGADCYAVAVESSDAMLACDGDLSRSCCGHLPMGEMVQITGKLSIGAYADSWWPKVEMTDICVE